MQQIALPGFTELTRGEAESIEGGVNPLSVAKFVVACFAAGFAFGYNELGPLLN